MFGYKCTFFRPGRVFLAVSACSFFLQRGCYLRVLFPIVPHKQLFPGRDWLGEGESRRRTNQDRACCRIKGAKRKMFGPWSGRQLLRESNPTVSHSCMHLHKQVELAACVKLCFGSDTTVTWPPFQYGRVWRWNFLKHLYCCRKICEAGIRGHRVTPGQAGPPV